MGLRPFALAVAAVAALAVPLLSPPKVPVPDPQQTMAEPSLPSLTTVPAPRVPTSAPSPLGSTPTTRTSTTRTPPTPVTGPTVTGPTVTTVPKFSGFLAQSVDFVTADEGFVLGYDRCGKGICFVLRRTVDAGASWAKLPAPPFGVGPPNNRATFDLHFANAFDGWALGPALWATDDGARTWHHVDLAAPVVAIASGAGEAYAAVATCPSSSVGCNGPIDLYRSSVGTGTWAEVQGAPGGLDYAPGHFSLVAEGRTVFLAAAYPRPELFVSADGAHFSRLPEPCNPDAGVGFWPGQLTASSAFDLALTCIGVPSMAYQPVEVFISHDGGRSFRELPRPTRVGLGAEAAMASPTTLVLGTSGAAGAWLERSVYPSTSWSTPFQAGHECPGLSDLSFVDPLHGAFVYCPASLALAQGAPGGAVYLTSDGGASWSAVQVPS